MDRRSMMRLTSAATITGGLAAGAAGTAHATRRADRQFTLDGRRTGANIPDVLTVGVPYYVRYELTDTEGRAAGTENAHCLPVTVGPDGAFVMATLVLDLADGMITASTAFQRPLPAVTELPLGSRRWTHEFAVTGGTGGYNGAEGSVSIEHLTRDEDTLTVTLTDSAG
ncbi:hypothetical protein ACFZAT_24705 [Streptomyces sp. NPDC008163]|uniref:hypothetical protein n=1 Tax=Streptomyces sp. NPDC008163 TaxID=3364818 RepID=UPI0036E42949